jgi:F-type H+-transporting ATPase subunit epsilon
MQVEVVSPERILFSDEGDMVTCRTKSGDIAFLPHHAPFIGLLETHPLAITLTSGEKEVVAVHGGVVEVSENRVIVLSDVAEMKDDIDVDRAKASRSDAQSKLSGKEGDDEEREAAEAQLRRAETRLEVAGASG